MRNIPAARRAYYALLLALFAFFLYLTAQIPYMHDDWDWGLPIGIEQLRTASINSRYVGNACVVALTRSGVLKTLVMALSFTLLPAMELRLVSRLGEKDTRKLPLLLFGALLLVLMPASIWRQSCGWVAGFCNFVLSALLLLGCHRLLFRPLSAPRPGSWALAGVLLYGVAMQLFLENVALYSVGVSLGLGLLRRVREKRFDPVLFALLLGNLLGLALLFSSGIYTVLFRDGQAMGATRELVPNDHVGLLPWLLRCLLYYIKYFPPLWGRNTLLSCAVLVLLALSAGKKQRLPLALVNLAFALYFLATAVFGDFALSTEKRSLYLAIALNFLYFCTVCLECLLIFRNRRRLCARLLFYWLSGPLVLLPLAITTMEGGRLFFTPYVLQSVFMLLLFSEFLSAHPFPRERTLSLVLCALLCGACLRLGLAYGEIGSAYRSRLALLQAESGEIVLPQLPHQELLWFPDPETQTRVGYFRAFYGVSDAPTLRFESGAPFLPW